MHMFIILIMDVIYLKKRSVFALITALLLICFIFDSNGQNLQKEELSKIYWNTMNKFLFPDYDTTIFCETLYFIEKPSYNPEYSLRVLKSENEVKLEGIFFKTSFSRHLMMNLIEKRELSVKPDFTFHSVVINSELATQLYNVIGLMIDRKYCPEIIKEIPLDGTNYYFRISQESGVEYVQFHSSELNAIRKEVVSLFSQIGDSLRIDTINDHEFIRIIDKIK